MILYLIKRDVPIGINHVDVSGKFVTEDGHYLRMGKVLAGEVIKTLEKADTSEDVELNLVSCSFELAVRHPSPLDVGKAKITADTIKESREELARTSHARLIEFSMQRKPSGCPLKKRTGSAWRSRYCNEDG